MVTGEAMPVAKGQGDPLIGGTINGAGALVMRAERVGAETLLARIVATVSEAQRSRAPIQGLADAVASYFVPAVIAVAIAAFIAWAALGPAPALTYALIAAVCVLIIACPCALGLATPMSVSVGIGRGASAGILIRSAEALERLEKIDTLVVDKTGTLTLGRPVVTRVIPVAGMEEAEIVFLAASLDRASQHPLAQALLTAAREHAIALEEASNFISLAGKGATGTVAGKALALGNAALMRDAGVDVRELAGQAEALRADGATVLYLAIGGRPAATIAISDPIKPTTSAALNALRRDGVRIVMLTGDHATTAQAVARTLGISDVRADISPLDKHRIVVDLKREGRIVAMAGDGINDAAALAQADVGIAMGAGADVAKQSAGITLVKGDLGAIARARALSRATMRNIRENLFFAFAYNIVGIPVAAGVLFPTFGILLSPALSALAMSLSSVCVIGNALRLRSVKL
jgi:P-type Cu+ transporter